jgi:hypothetical protein
MEMRIARIAAFICVCLAIFSARVRCEEPVHVNACELQANPAAYDHKLISVEAFVSHDFEDFTIFDPTCRSFGVWLEYGGTKKSDTVFCCGPTAGKEREKELVVEGISVPLIENELFRTFDREIQPPFRSGRSGSVVHASLLGRFFAGRKQTFANGETGWTGFGHMGCCSLLAIQEVQSVSLQDRDDIDYGASYDQPDIAKAGCGFQFLTPIESANEIIDAQHKAELQPESGAFDNPDHVVSEFLSAKGKSSDSLESTVTRKAPGRIVYEVKDSKSKAKYMVVLSKPFWLTFYAHDLNHIAWIPVAAYKVSCGGENSVIRLR